MTRDPKKGRHAQMRGNGIDPEAFEAVIFDLDGVITETADAHAAAWKELFDTYNEEREERGGQPFRPFDLDRDYPKHLDGKPRYDGVRDFLASRGIKLPEGSPDDPPDAETVCGLGNRKNRHFQEWLKANKVKTYDDAVRFISVLREAGIRTGIISSSKNCAAVLHNAGVSGLFDVKVDGVDMARLGLPGKPDPTIFHQAAERLGVRPEKAAVVEDAISGVQAGARGGFSLVIGVDRHGGAGNPDVSLQDHGADLVVGDLSEIEISGPFSGALARPVSEVPPVWQEETRIRDRMNGRRPVVFLDFDGTLAPIVDDYRDAKLGEDMRQAVRRLAEQCPVAVVSGRDLHDIRERVDLDGLFYAGSHGFDIAGPDMRQTLQKGREFLPELDAAEQEVRKAVGNIQGAAVERKRFSIATHYRQVQAADISAVEEAVDAAIAAHSGLRKSLGKKVFQIQPKTDWDKGRAVDWLLEQLGLDEPDVLPIYVGDDITDEDAFRALRDNGGLGVVVREGSETRTTVASYAVESIDDVRRFLDSLRDMQRNEKTAAGDAERCMKRVAPEGWSLIYDGYEPAQEGLRETLCALGNGFFCTRGAAPDAMAGDVHYPGTYLAGGYNRLITKIAGREVENEDLVNIPNWLPLTIRIDDGEAIRPDEVEYLDYRQELALDEGMLLRFCRFRDRHGRTTRWEERRFVSMADQHLAALSVTVTAEDWEGNLTVRSELDGTVVNDGVARYRDLAGNHLETIDRGDSGADSIWLLSRTTQSNLVVAEAARIHFFRGDEEIRPIRNVETLPDLVAQEAILRLKAGEALSVHKTVALFTSRDQAISEPSLAAREKVAKAAPFDEAFRAHRLIWKQLWERFDIRLEEGHGEAEAILKLRLHVFHLLQTVSRHARDLDIGIPPRGWHGEAYRGHIMWDELFILPLLNLRDPTLTRSLLRYRYRRLPAARRLARDAGFRGAMYPWQSGSDGREESQVVHLNPESGRWIPDNSHRQRHINSAVAYNVWQYYQVTDDRDFLYEFGAEILAEIARFWASIAEYSPDRDRFEIHGVMGPDEFHTAYPDADPSREGGLNNNAYTNVTAAWTLTRARDALELLNADQAKRLRERLNLSDAEIKAWEEISRKMFVPFHGDGIISQFEGYEGLEEFDWDGYRERYGDIQRLDRILEAEGDTPNRYKASKQADVLMLFYLFSSEELSQVFEQLGYSFDPGCIPRNIEYYLQRTSHGSTLSWIVHSWVLSRGDRSGSWELFLGALESDIGDIQGGTTPEGIHLGAMAGTVDLVQRCYTGLETRGGILHINPSLPDRLHCLKARVYYRKHLLDLDITHERLRITSPHCAAAPVTVAYRGRFREICPGAVFEFRLIKPNERDRGDAGLNSLKAEE